MTSFDNIKFDKDYVEADVTDAISEHEPFTAHCRMHRKTAEFSMDCDKDDYYIRKGMLVVTNEVNKGKIKQGGHRACIWS